MTETPLSELDPRLQKQVTNASKAIDRGNPGYAIPICMDILKRHPGCVEVRKVLRKAQQRAAGDGGGMKKIMAKVTTAPFMLRGGSMAKKNPEKLIEASENLITQDPKNTIAHRLLGSAAEELGLWQTAAFAYETIREQEPDNPDNLKSLARAYIEDGRGKEAVTICERILRDNPGDGEGQELVKRASVAVSMERGSWEKEGDFREKLKDEAEATELEQASRAKTDEAGLKDLIKRAEVKIADNPEDVNPYRDIAGYYKRLGDLESALEWVRKARKLPTGRTDVTFERLEQNLEIDKRSQELDTKVEALKEDPDNSDLQEEVEQLRSQLHAFKLEQAKAMVDRYPNDYGYRYEYGVLLFEKGDNNEAIKQLQVAQKNPKVRSNALVYLGKALKAGKKYDLAAEQLETAKQEAQIMNDTKKAIIYELAECYEQMGETEKAMAEYKALYSADIGYRDVADKIDAFYSN
ncbi:MAG: tetratricopeptide repeat protein [Opitutales bacterium]